MLRSLRLLLLTVLVSLSYPLLRCDAQKTAAQYDGGEPPLQVDVRLQGMSQPSLKPTPAASATPSSTPSPSPTPTPTPEPTPFSLYWISDTQVYAYRYPQVFNKVFAYGFNDAPMKKVAIIRDMIYLTDEGLELGKRFTGPLYGSYGPE